MGNVNNEGGCVCVGSGNIWEISLSSPQFCYQPKTALRIVLVIYIYFTIYVLGKLPPLTKNLCEGEFFIYYVYSDSNFNLGKMNVIIQQCCALILFLNIGQSLENMYKWLVSLSL